MSCKQCVFLTTRMLSLWSIAFFQQLKRMNCILIWYSSMYLKLYIAWSSTITSWTKGCHLYMWNFIHTRYSVGFLILFCLMLLNRVMVEMLIKIGVWQIFRALSYIHRCIGVCHRDIKPQNLLVCSNTCFYCNMISSCWLIIVYSLFAL